MFTVPFFRAVGRRLGPVVQSAGACLEKASVSAGAIPEEPAYIAYRNMWDMDEGKTEFKPSWDLVTVPDHFIAPTAKVSAETKVSKDSAVWYNAEVSGNVSILSKASVLEHSKVAGSASKKTVIGNEVVIHPRCSIGEGVTIGDRSVISAGATLETGVVVEEEAVVGSGSHVLSGTTVKKREYWAGNPAVLIRTLEQEELESNSTFTAELCRLALIHTREHQKDVYLDHAARRVYKDCQTEFVDDMLDRAENPDDIFVNMDINPVYYPERRGLTYDSESESKGNDK